MRCQLLRWKATFTLDFRPIVRIRRKLVKVVWSMVVLFLSSWTSRRLILPLEISTTLCLTRHNQMLRDWDGVVSFHVVVLYLIFGAYVVMSPFALQLVRL